MTALAVPAYVHPSDAPDVWVRLAHAARDIRFVVVNADSGPGADVDPAYPAVIERLAAAKVRMAGYVDTDYARRSVDDVVADARLWVTRYGVRGVFLDQVAGDFAHLEYYAACALGARANGAQFVVANPGIDAHEGLAEIANVTVTFEGTWRDYLGYRPAAPMRDLPAERFCHLVYDVPSSLLGDGPAMAAARHAGSAFFTDGGGANPWDRLPSTLVDAVTRARQAPGRPATARAPLHSSAASRWGVRRYATGT